jgi:hypothetical protein
MPIVYKTTNCINGKMYIGVDSKNNNSYLGSGKILKLALEKYGVENFQKEIIKEFLTVEEAYAYEEELINSLDAVNSEMYYNVMEGGKGGWSHIDTKGSANPMHGKSVRDKMIEKHGVEKGNLLYEDSRIRAGKNTSVSLSGVEKSDTHKAAISKARIKFWNNLSEEEKTVRSEEYKNKMSESLKLKSNQIHKKMECPYCKLMVNRPNLKRWHGENCKHR